MEKKREKAYGEEPRRSPRRDEDAGRVYSERELILTTTRKLRYGKGALLHEAALSL